ncbi:hypothetical protein RDI58_009396 [Solanum bulbocastanum]|uniref:At1g61320/AtMIF1 LRR domain-containing protein n=1 Tax=Solanum bulbocastanum TaxID=147425 RepID=A0AAN8YL04_SOLBU
MAEIIDRISDLPAHIIYDILRKVGKYHNLREEARTCILSKRWSSIWRWRPDVIISKYNHKGLKNNLENFVKSVDDSLLPYAEHNLRIETLCLIGLAHPGLTSHIDRWLNLAIKHNVRSLNIYSNSMKNSKYYSIPDALHAAKMLTELSLRRCSLEVDDSTNKLQQLINTCQLIRNLSVDDCKGIHNLCVAGLVNLEKLELLNCEGLKKIEIQAPNLRVFAFKGAPLSMYQKTREVLPLPCTINILDGYKTLQILKLEAATMTDQEFEYKLSKFSALEVLELTRCYEIKKIKIVSHKLKRFTLWYWRNLKQVDLLTPNLREFDFESGKMCMPFSTMVTSNLKRANIFFYKRGSYVDPDIVYGNVDTSWYNNVQDFVRKLDYSKGLVLVILCRQYKSILIYEDPSEIIIPPTREIKLRITNPLMYLEKFAYDLIKSDPKIISIVPCTESKMVQVFHEMIMRYRKKQNKELPNEVINHNDKDAVEDDGTTPFYSWLKSTPLIERITNFMF